MMKEKDRISLKGVEIITFEQKNYRATIKNLEIKPDYLVIELHTLRCFNNGKKGLPGVWVTQNPENITIPYCGKNFRWLGLNHSPALLIFAHNGDEYYFFGEQDTILQLEGFA